MDSLLLVDDNKNMRLILRESLERHNFMVMEAAHGKRLLEILERHNVDLILLDVRLPDGCGVQFLSDIRIHTDAPVVLMSGDRDKESALKGFKAGADDYIGKPFDTEIMIAKLKAILQRHRNSKLSSNTLLKQSDSLQFSKWILDRSQFQIFDQNHQSGDLTPCEFTLLDTLIRHAGCAVKRDALCEAVRKDNYTPTGRAIDVKIMRIRKKIGDRIANPQFISTVRGVGYMFNRNQITV